MNFGTKCERMIQGCAAEDCACCEVYLEAQAQERQADDRWDKAGDADEPRNYDGCSCSNCGADITEAQADDNHGLCECCAAVDDYEDERDGDATSALASAGFGTDEDYGGRQDEDTFGDDGYED